MSNLPVLLVLAKKHPYWFSFILVVQVIISIISIISINSLPSAQILPKPPHYEVKTVMLSGIPVKLMIADTPERRTHGLMLTNNLCDDCGMLFIFDKSEVLSFWMKNTPLPLSIAFIKDNGAVDSIHDMSPQALDSHTSLSPVRYAIEMKQGWFTRHPVRFVDTKTLLT